MEPDQSLQDDLAAQEAAARTWQPDIDVRSSPQPTAPILNNCPFDAPRRRSFNAQRVTTGPTSLDISSQLTTCCLTQGPRVGDKTPIDAITAEYAKADPVYVAKTMVSCVAALSTPSMSPAFTLP